MLCDLAIRFYHHNTLYSLAPYPTSNFFANNRGGWGGGLIFKDLFGGFSDYQ